MKTSDLKYHSKYELQTMHRNNVIDYCPSCKKYHVKENKPRWPLFNISYCDSCKKTNDTVRNMLEEN